MLQVYLLQISNFFSGLANALVVITIPWLVLEVTDSPAFAGVVLALSSIPSLIMSPLSGVFIQKLGKRQVSIGADILSTLSVVAFPILALTAGLTGSGILLLALIGALFDPVGYTARKTLITSVSRSSGFNIERLNGIHEGLFGVSWVAGPALGAGLISWFGVINSFWVAGACFIIAAVSVMLLKQPQDEELEESVTSSRTDFWIGFRLLWQDKLLRVVTLSVLVIASVYLPTESVVLSTYYERLSEPASLGLVISAIAGGSTLSAFGYGWLVTRISGRSLMRIAFLGASFSTLAMSFLPSLPLMIAGALALGLSWGPFNPLINSMIQQRVSEENHGMVYGAQGSAFYAAPPLGMVLTGIAVENYGVQATYHGLGILLIFTSIVVLLTKSLREKF